MRRTRLCGATSSVLLLTGAVSGCGALGDLQDNLKGLSESTVAEMMVLGVEPPEGNVDLGLDGTDLSEGTSLKVLVVDADSSAALSEMAGIDAKFQMAASDIRFCRFRDTHRNAGSAGNRPQHNP